MMRLTFLTAALAVALGGCATAPGSTAPNLTQTCHPASEQDIAALFDRWNASLQTGDPKKVVANYSSRSLLLPTVSNRPRQTAAEIEDYFVYFLKDQPSGAIVSRMISIGCNTALDTGLYNFTFAKTGKSVAARYTYTYEWKDGQWLITSHHSSALPEQ